MPLDGVFTIALDASGEEDNGPASAWPLRQFVGGAENALARVAAEAVLNPSPRYNPVVFCGPTGVGKSHLMHGLARRCRSSQGRPEARRGEVAANPTPHSAALGAAMSGSGSGGASSAEGKRPAAKVVIVSGADFARSYAHAVETDTLAHHRARLVQAALFVLDGLEELVKKPPAQQELIHTLDAARDEGTQVLVASREPLAPGGALLPGLASRLSGGLVVPLTLPGPEARRALLDAILQDRPEAMTEEARALLADALCGTADELRHAVLQLCEAAAHEERPVPADAVRHYLDEQADQRRPTLNKIATQVARRFRLRLTDLQGKTRRREVVQARGVAMLLARQLTGASYETVGRHFGGRDHTTVMHACRRTTELLGADPTLQRAVQELAGSWK